MHNMESTATSENKPNAKNRLDLSETRYQIIFMVGLARAIHRLKERVHLLEDELKAMKGNVVMKTPPAPEGLNTLKAKKINAPKTKSLMRAKDIL